MSMKTSIPLGIGVILAVIFLGVIGTAMLITDQGEEMLHFYREARGATRSATPPPLPGSGFALRGKWRDVALVDPQRARAQALGLRDVEGGVAVAEVGAAGAGSGLAPGDLIVGVEKQRVRDLADLHRISNQVDPLTPVLLEVKRGEQAMTVVLPPEQGVVTLAPGATAGGAIPPAAVGSPPAPAGGNPPAAGGPWAGGAFRAVAQPAGPGAHLYCPRDQVVIPQQAATPPYNCPYCRGPLQPYGGAR